VTVRGTQIDSNSAEGLAPGDGVELGGGFGGGIANTPGGTVNLTESAVTNNSARVDGGGIDNDPGGTVTLNATSVHANFPDNCAGPGLSC
jgi:hypothetical protein